MTMHKTFVSARAVTLIVGATLVAGGKAAADQVIPDDRAAPVSGWIA